MSAPRILATAALFVSLLVLAVLIPFGVSGLERSARLIENWQTLIAGLVGFGGLAWVTYKNAELEREERQLERNSWMTFVAFEISHINQDLATISKLLLDGRTHSTTSALTRLKSLPSFQALHGDLERSAALPTNFLSGALYFRLLKDDLRANYVELNSVEGHGDDSQIKKLRAAILNCIEQGNSAITIAERAVPELENQQLRISVGGD